MVAIVDEELPPIPMTREETLSPFPCRLWMLENFFRATLAASPAVVDFAVFAASKVLNSALALVKDSEYFAVLS